MSDFEKHNDGRTVMSRRTTGGWGWVASGLLMKRGFPKHVTFDLRLEEWPGAAPERARGRAFHSERGKSRAPGRTELCVWDWGKPVWLGPGRVREREGDEDRSCRVLWAVHKSLNFILRKSKGSHWSVVKCRIDRIWFIFLKGYCCKKKRL